MKSECCVKKNLTKICNFFSKKSQKTKISSLTLSGVIGKDSRFESGINFNNCQPLIKKAFEEKNIKAVAISINSPGGSPVQSELICDYICELSREKKIPVYTFAQDLAASGGYWLLLAGDEIYAHSSSIIGSIGVIFSSFGFVELIKKIGVERRIYTEGKNKAILDPFTAEVDENIEILKDCQRDIFVGFKDFVKERRKDKLTQDDEFLDGKIFTGAFWSGKKALELGLIDGVADLRSKMKEKFGHEIDIVNITAKKSFIKSLFSEKLSLVENLISKIEERLIFNKFGL
jgi:signal peptide peptidase SppA